MLLTRSVEREATTVRVGVGQETQSCVPEDSQEVYVQQQTQKEIVVGSIIGSAMVLVVVVFVVGFVVVWRRKVKRGESR